jgi:hypothetical protein
MPIKGSSVIPYKGEKMSAKNPRNIKIAIAVFVLSVCSFFLFFKLGYYALWDDEATTALYAKSVWRTGDTSALIDHNLVAYESGKELKNLKNRFIPPLQFYLAAPFVGLSNGSAFAARFPFALCGLLTVAVMLLWLWRENASISIWLLTSAGIITNVSLMLFSRQCRYYALAILTTIVLAFLYFYHDGRKRISFSIALVSLCLLASNYLCYVAAYACLFTDYLVWGRKSRPFSLKELAIIFSPQIILGSLLIYLYNPFVLTFWKNTKDSFGLSRILTLLFWNLREINTCEFGVGVLILIAPLLYFYTKDKRLLRGPLTIFIYCLTISMLSHQRVGPITIAIVRYIAPLIPLCIITSAFSIHALTAKKKWLAVLLAVLAFSTNIFHGGTHINKAFFSKHIPDSGFRSTIAEFTKKLISPPPSAYRETSNWINRNIKQKESILVMPGFATYPLMYHASKAMYAWQLKEETGQFIGLDDNHFMNRIPPEYIIVFGPPIKRINRLFKKLEERDIHYLQVERLNLYWYDLIRPELYWHSFDEIQSFSSSSEAIYIFKQQH